MSGPNNRLELKQSQRLALSPALQQSVGILALSGPSLEESMAEAAAENPFLVYTPYDWGGSDGAFRTSPYEVALQTVAARPSLGEHIAGQITLLGLPNEVAAAAKQLAYDLDENGFFTQGSESEIALEHGLPVATAIMAVRAIQGCEPSGVGAFNLTQCIKLQLSESGLSAQRVELVMAGLPYFIKDQTDMIGPALGLTAREAAEMTSLVRSLDPAPGRAFDEAEPVVRVPELLVTQTESSGLAVELINDSGPRLTLDEALVSARGEGLEAHLAQARALVSAVHFRGKTLLRIGKAVADAQAAYFTGRSKSLAPLTRSAIAERLELHKSTVGRTVGGKSLVWRGQVIEMDSLFPAALRSDGAEPTSSHAAQLEIARLVAAETAGSVLSDEAICTKLKHDGVDISRRTVAKYRKCLNIPSSSKRRRLLTQSAEQRRTR